MSQFTAAVLARLPEQRLIQLTNDDLAATIIDTAVLTAACIDAESMFELEAGIIPLTTINMHIMAIVVGTQYFLESYKGRDNSIFLSFQKRFLGLLKSVRSKRKLLPQSNSPLDPSVQRQGTRPDMDRKNQVFRPGNRDLFFSDNVFGGD